MKTIIEIENDGLNLAIDNKILFVRANRSIFSFDLTNNQEINHNQIFSKDGKARFLCVSEKYLLLLDFCDLLLVHKETLQMVKKYHLGSDLSTDLLAVRSDDTFAYVSMRNGKMVKINLQDFSQTTYAISPISYWDHCLFDNHLYLGTVDGRLIDYDLTLNQVKQSITLGKKNIYSLSCHENKIYSVSQDTSIQRINANTFEVEMLVKKAVKGMPKILGVVQDYLVIADGKISLWNKNTLTLEKTIMIPTGHFNKGAILWGNKVIGSDYHSIIMEDIL
jgi:WD40 repeat protein